ncbi:MAG: hypothetical protein A2Y64_08215 [Candidatus Coatesbacteria bacterium RBG_13_66_14]|uniref:Uncharacterized protein n=1 Tax=Candidatus Coatesbacteria bacterium RBG_13_66_14 TaxID=1817816 RepID=A0A1F5EXA7_9BACT|nr:MAG: hypothetical protein A2Y64_08215 [Candidatus Coatesbacteria bacterium RBG_13_66_14]
MRRSLRFLIFILAVLPLGVRCEGGTAVTSDGSLALYNDTSYYLHLSIGGADFPWTPPGDSTPRVGVDIGQTLRCTAAYSPGQGPTGRTEFDFTASAADSDSGVAVSCDAGIGTACDPLVTDGSAPHYQLSVTEEMLGDA